MTDYRLSAVRLEIDFGRAPVEMLVQLPFCLGSDPSADIRWSDGTLDPFHCEIYRVADLCYVRTLSPTSRLSVNYRAVSGPAILQHHDVLSLGNATIRILLPHGVDPVEMAEHEEVPAEVTPRRHAEPIIDTPQRIAGETAGSLNANKASPTSRRSPQATVAPRVGVRTSVAPRNSAPNKGEPMRAAPKPIAPNNVAQSQIAPNQVQGSDPDRPVAQPSRQAVLPPLVGVESAEPTNIPARPLMLVLENDRASEVGPINAGALQSLQVEPRPLRKP